MQRSLPIGFMYGIFIHIYHKKQPNVGEYTIHGSCGLYYQPRGHYTTNDPLIEVC